ncbi:MAG: hypothetical protein WD097_04280 [Balneolales bacterium]
MIHVSPIVAQQQNDRTSLLPDIDPQDIEIRGDFEASFPGLSRQPVLGFDPRPGIFRVDPDRMPFLESDDEIVAAIPISDLEPALKPEQRFIQFANRRVVFSRVGYGAYNTPELTFIAETPLRQSESVLLDLSHHSSTGDRDFSSYRDLAGELQWTKQSGANRWGAGMKGSSSNNYSPYLVSDSLLLPPTITDSDPQRISHHSLGAEVRWQNLKNAYRGWQSALSLDRFSIRAGMPVDEVLQSDETKYRVHINRFWEGRLMEQVFGVRVEASGAFYDTAENTNQYWLTNSFGARYHQRFGTSHTVEAWLRLYQLYDPVNEFDLYLYPDIRYQFYRPERVSAAIWIRGFVNDPSLAKLQSRNRFFIQSDTDLEHERGLNINLHSDLKLIGNLKVYTGLDYWQYYNNGFFMRYEEITNPYYRYSYVEEATQVEWYSGFSQSLPVIETLIAVELGLNYSSVNEDIVPSGEIPYVPRWRGSTHVISSPISWLDISIWLDLIGQRKTYLEEVDIDGFVQLGAQTDIRLHNRFGAFVKVLNILNKEYEVWQDYKERPFQLSGGITLHW